MQLHNDFNALVSLWVLLVMLHTFRNLVFCNLKNEEILYFYEHTKTMGIKGLKQFLRTKFPTTLVTSHLSHWWGKKVAIDLLPYLYRYKVSYGDQWKCGLFIFMSLFIRNNVHATVLMDGPNVYKEKDGERAKRAKNKNKIKEKHTQLKSDLKQYELDKTTTPLLLSISKEKSIHRNLLLMEDESVDLNAVHAYLEKIDNQMVSILPSDISTVAHMCSLLSIPFYYASQEAESFASYLCLNGNVDAVVTEDTDVLAYGSTHWISSLAHDGTCTEIMMADILNQMELSRPQFLDFCILCGTDYNESLKGIGPVSSYKHVREGLDAFLETYTGSVDELNRDKVRTIFDTPCDTTLDQSRLVISFNPIPEKENLMALKRESYPVQPILIWLDHYVDKFQEEGDVL